MNFETRLNELNLTKARLETEIDTLPYDVKYRDKKLIKNKNGTHGFVCEF